MTQLINLLPWRALQRRRRLRCRIGITVLVTLLLASGVWIAWALLHQKIITLQNQGDELEVQRQRLQETVQYQQALLQRGEQQQQAQLTETGRQDRVSRWEGILDALAGTLPESSWLRTVSWQSGVLTLEGYTADIGDLEKIEMQLTKLPGRFQVKPGPVSYHAAQGLSYTFILEEKGGKFVLP